MDLGTQHKKGKQLTIDLTFTRLDNHDAQAFYVLHCAHCQAFWKPSSRPWPVSDKATYMYMYTMMSSHEWGGWDNLKTTALYRPALLAAIYGSLHTCRLPSHHGLATDASNDYKEEL